MKFEKIESELRKKQNKIYLSNDMKSSYVMN